LIVPAFGTNIQNTLARGLSYWKEVGWGDLTFYRLTDFGSYASETITISCEIAGISYETADISYEKMIISYETVMISYETGTGSYETLIISYEKFMISYERAAVSYEMPVISYDAKEVSSGIYLGTATFIHGADGPTSMLLGRPGPEL
jgi:hypothetical protein